MYLQWWEPWHRQVPTNEERKRHLQMHSSMQKRGKFSQEDKKYETRICVNNYLTSFICIQNWQQIYNVGDQLYQGSTCTYLWQHLTCRWLQKYRGTSL